MIFSISLLVIILFLSAGISYSSEEFVIEAEKFENIRGKVFADSTADVKYVLLENRYDSISTTVEGLFMEKKYSVWLRIKFPDRFSQNYRTSYRSLYRDYKILDMTIGEKSSTLTVNSGGDWRWVKCRDVKVEELESGSIVIERREVPIKIDKIAVTSDESDFLKKENEKSAKRFKNTVVFDDIDKDYIEYGLCDFEKKKNGKETVIDGQKSIAFSDSENEYSSAFKINEDVKGSVLLRVRNKDVTGYSYPVGVWIDNQCAGWAYPSERQNWYWIVLREVEIKYGTHHFYLESSVSNLIINKIVVYLGNKDELFSKEWYRNGYTDLFSRKDAVVKQISNEIFSEITPDDFCEVKTNVVKFRETDKLLEFNTGPPNEGFCAGLINIADSGKYYFYINLYYDRDNENFMGGNSIIFMIDGHTTFVFRDGVFDKWHWVSTGEVYLEKGIHYVGFGRRSSPVLFSSMMISKTNKVEKEEWYKNGKEFFRQLPFGISNEVPIRDAKRYSNWIVLGQLADSVKAGTAGLKNSGNWLKLDFEEKDTGQNLILQDVVPVSTPQATEKENNYQYIDMSVCGDLSGFEIHGLYVDKNGEIFKGRFYATDEKDSEPRIVSMNLGGFSKEGLLEFAGGDKNGIIDFPVKLKYIVFVKTSPDRQTIYVKKPYFKKPFGFYAEIENKYLKVDESAKVRIKVINNSKEKRSSDIRWHIAKNSMTDKRIYFEVEPESSVEKTIDYKPEKEGIYELFYNVGVCAPKRVFLCAGEDNINSFKNKMLELERSKGSFRISEGDKPLRKKDGSVIKREEVRELYGKEDGFVITCDGIDVCSRGYAEKNCFTRIYPEGRDLSDGAGWPYIDVPPGVLAIDPESGRIKFSEGYSGKMEILGWLHSGFGVPSAKLVKDGDYLYEAPGEGDLTVVDISDRRNPKVCNYLKTWFFYGAVIKYKNYLYINAGRDAGLWAVSDISYPENPLIMESVTCGAGIYPRINWVNEKENFGYGYNAKDRILYLFDIEEYNRLTLCDSISGINSILFDKDRKYFVCTRDSGVAILGNQTERICVYDLSDPKKPVMISEFNNFKKNEFMKEFTKEEDLLEEEFDKDMDDVIKGEKQKEKEEETAKARYYKDGILIISFEGGKQLGFVDLKEKNNPKNIFLLEIEREISDLEIAGNYLYLIPVFNKDCESLHRTSERSEIWIYDVSVINDVRFVSKFNEEFPTSYRTIIVDDSFGYVADYDYGVWIFDISDINKIKKISGVATAGEGHWAYVQDTIAMVANTFSGSMIISDVSDPFEIKRVGEYWDGEWMNYCGEIKGRGNAVYLPKHQSLAIVDITDPSKPKRVGMFVTDKGVPIVGGDLEVEDDVAYVSGVDEKNGVTYLFVFDVKTPEKPKFISKIEIGKFWRLMIDKYKDAVYLMNDMVIFTISVSDAKNPKILGSLKFQDLKNYPDFEDKDLFYSLDKKDFPKYFMNQMDFSQMGVNNNYLYAVSGSGDGEAIGNYMNVFNANDAKNIKYVKTISMERWNWAYEWDDIIRHEDYIITSMYACLDMLDIRDPENPKVIDTLRLPTYQYKIGRIQNGLLYCPTLSGLFIVRVPSKSQVPKGGVELK